MNTILHSRKNENFPKKPLLIVLVGKRVPSWFYTVTRGSHEYMEIILLPLAMILHEIGYVLVVLFSI